MSEELDLGHGHYLRFSCWAPDRDLNPQYAHLPDVAKFGAIIRHKRPDDGTDCLGAITFDGPVQRQLVPDRHLWIVQSLDPLTLTPSLLCNAGAPLKCPCGDHGHIKNGKWVPA